MPRPPTITAEIRQWQLDDERRVVQGKIFDDLDGLLDGDNFSIGFICITDYPDDLLARSVAGRYYKLVKKYAKDPDNWTTNVIDNGKEK